MNTMYSACLFCHRSLGRNDALERFTVGRRLAYDPARGRLWVVCPRCARWNLSPLETRWEAIEEAERAFRGTALRVATDNIALARLREGLELVRVGAPPRLELATWRYGDRFRRRFRKQVALVGTAATVPVTYYGTLIAAHVYRTTELASLFTWLSAAGALGYAGVQATFSLRLRRDGKVVATFIRGTDGTTLGLTRLNVRCVALVPSSGGTAWTLKVPYRAAYDASGAVLPVRNPRDRWADGSMQLHDDAATRALATMLPYINRAGASGRRVRDAVDQLERFQSLDHLLRAAAVNREALLTHVKVAGSESNVSILPPRLRLAMEMVLHEESERRALDGEMHALEARWRDAEEIAAIADALLVSPEVDARVTELRKRFDRVGRH